MVTAVCSCRVSGGWAGFQAGRRCGLPGMSARNRPLGCCSARHARASLPPATDLGGKWQVHMCPCRPRLCNASLAASLLPHRCAQVRYDKRVGDNTAIKFMTDGILLRWAAGCTLQWLQSAWAPRCGRMRQRGRAPPWAARAQAVAMPALPALTLIPANLQGKWWRVSAMVTDSCPLRHLLMQGGAGGLFAAPLLGHPG